MGRYPRLGESRCYHDSSTCSGSGARRVRGKQQRPLDSIPWPWPRLHRRPYYNGRFLPVRRPKTNVHGIHESY